MKKPLNHEQSSSSEFWLSFEGICVLRARMVEDTSLTGFQKTQFLGKKIRLFDVQQISTSADPWTLKENFVSYPD